MSDDVFRWVVTLEVLLATVVLVVYLVLYMTRSNWKATEAGKSSVAFAAVVLLLLARSLIGRLLGPLGDFVWGILLIALDWVAIWRLIILLRLQRTAGLMLYPTKERKSPMFRRFKFRDPLMLTAIVTALLTVLGTFSPWVQGIDVLVQGVLLAVMSLVMAWKVRPIAPAFITGVIVAGFDLAARFGFHASYEQVGALDAVTILVIGYITRSQVTPKALPQKGIIPTPAELAVREPLG